MLVHMHHWVLEAVGADCVKKKKKTTKYWLIASVSRQKQTKIDVNLQCEQLENNDEWAWVGKGAGYHHHMKEICKACDDTLYKWNFSKVVESFAAL